MGKDPRIPDTVSDVSMDNACTQTNRDICTRTRRQRNIPYVRAYTAIPYTQAHTGSISKQSLPTRPSFHSVTLHEVTLAAVEGTLH